VTHDEVLELLPAYLDAELHEVGEIERHLASCDECSAELASYRVMLAELSSLPDSDTAPRAGLAARAIAQILERSAAARIRGAAREHPVAVAAGIGGAAIAAIATVYAINRSRRTTHAVAEATA